MIRKAARGILLMASFVLLESTFFEVGAKYVEIPVIDGGQISGKITFQGEIPKPKVFQLRHFPDEKYCSRISDRRGNRLVQEVRVGRDETLQDLVVYIRGVLRGKPFEFNGTDVKARDCEFLVQDGPSTFTGVVVRNREIRLLNDDANPSNAPTAIGVRHNPHSHEVIGIQKRTMFKALLPNKGQVIKRRVALTVEDSFMKLECDIHDFMQTYFLPVQNPYYAIVGEGGRYQIDDIPPGRYKITAWHPILGTMTKEVSVPPLGKANLDFAFSR